MNNRQNAFNRPSTQYQEPTSYSSRNQPSYQEEESPVAMFQSSMRSAWKSDKEDPALSNRRPNFPRENRDYVCRIDRVSIIESRKTGVKYIVIDFTDMKAGSEYVHFIDITISPKRLAPYIKKDVGRFLCAAMSIDANAMTEDDNAAVMGILRGDDLENINFIFGEQGLSGVHVKVVTTIKTSPKTDAEYMETMLYPTKQPEARGGGESFAEVV